MLGSAKLVAFTATRDIECAKAFYCGVLGLRLVSEDPFALVFDANGRMLRVSKVAEVSVAPYTVLGWDVPDITSTVRGLTNAGVAFERFPGMTQDEFGIWTSPNGSRVAWFKDPGGEFVECG
jgi:catechol 2,3-dioxygenase-like lactoylglutathione lyase family enzyme